MLPPSSAVGAQSIRKFTPSAITNQPGIDRETRKALSQFMHHRQAAVREHLSLSRDALKRSEELTKASENFCTLYDLKVDLGAGLPVMEGQGFRERREKTLLWTALTNSGDFEAYMFVLRAAEVVRREADAQDLDLLDLMTGQIILYYNFMFEKIQNEDQVPIFISILKTTSYLFEAKMEAAKGELLDPVRSQVVLSDYASSRHHLIPAICDIILENVHSFAYIADPTTEIWEATEIGRGVFIPDFVKIYLDLVALPELSVAAVVEIFKTNFHMFEEMSEVNVRIKRTFYERLSVIKKRMDSQFRDRSDFEVRLPKVASNKTNRAPRNLTLIGPEVKPVVQEDASRGLELHMSPLVNIPEKKSSRSAHAERKQTAAASKAEKLAKRKVADAAKHARLVAALEEEESDDKDVHLYYSSISQAASRTFELNQKNQAFKSTFPASARFRHSIYPNLTASGTTINFLCSLLVSGTPDYDGFCAAHADLGGMRDDKKNGGKLFYFLDPIKYHKTLHRPHASSDFDHVLYRRFYRNCALHPYYFLLDSI